MRDPIITNESLNDTLYINNKPLSSICDQKAGKSAIVWREIALVPRSTSSSYITIQTKNATYATDARNIATME